MFFFKSKEHENLFVKYRTILLCKETTWCSVMNKSILNDNCIFHLFIRNLLIPSGGSCATPLSICSSCATPLSAGGSCATPLSAGGSCATPLSAGGSCVRSPSAGISALFITVFSPDGAGPDIYTNRTFILDDQYTLEKFFNNYSISRDLDNQENTKDEFFFQ
jgi:hypothetical protein